MIDVMGVPETICTIWATDAKNRVAPALNINVPTHISVEDYPQAVQVAKDMLVQHASHLLFKKLTFIVESKGEPVEVSLT